ncbi:MAG: hypothetical protein O6952_07305, partial [Planctomycetota bacterium]|nr:hypothetical protein [Planctomycetota bacterium]
MRWSRGSGSRFGGWVWFFVLGAGLAPISCGGSSSSKKPAPRPDLTITSFSVVLNGDIPTWTVDVTNQGAADAIDVIVDLYEDQPARPNPGDVGDNCQFVPLIRAGETRLVFFSSLSLAPGQYVSWAQVDSPGDITESSESNNITVNPEIFTVPLPPVPDLLITAFSATVNNLDVDYLITVQNQGTGNATLFYIDLYYDLASVPVAQQTGDDFIPVFGLTAGSSLTFQKTRIGSPPGVFDSYVQVDTLEQVAETDETNNLFGPLQVTVAPPNTPEIIISAFSASVTGQDVTYDLMVENIGLVNSVDFWVDLYYDRTNAPTVAEVGDDGMFIAGGLAAGTAMPLVFTRTLTPTGAYQSWVQADTFNMVSESFETNNVEGPERHLVGPELEISAYRTDFNGVDVDYTIVVENFGSQTSGTFVLDVYFHRDPILEGPPGPFEFGDDFTIVADLAPGAMTMLSFLDFGSSSTRHISYAQVDTDDDVIEVDESNNIFGSVEYNLGDTLAA